jgi:hypothetical protein
MVRGASHHRSNPSDARLGLLRGPQTSRAKLAATVAELQV